MIGYVAANDESGRNNCFAAVNVTHNEPAVCAKVKIIWWKANVETNETRDVKQTTITPNKRIVN